jgi:hypothetical protein
MIVMMQKVNTLFSYVFLYVPPLMSETKFHTHTTLQEGKLVLYILIITFLDSRQEDKTFWTEGTKHYPNSICS